MSLPPHRGACTPPAELHHKTIKIALIFTSFMAVALIILITTGAILTTTRWIQLKQAIEYASLSCNNKKCDQYSPDDTLPLINSDVTTAGVYTPHIARYAADLISRLTNNSKLSKKHNNQYIMPALTHVASFTSKRQKRAGGWLLVDSVDIPTVCWVVFRGTGSNHEWRKNMTVEQVPFYFTHTNKNSQILVHRGFYEMYTSIRKQLLHSIQPYLKQPIPIYITGHSMGAALATLATLELSQLPNIRLHTYTFATPRVGNQALKIAVANTLTFFQIVNLTDIVFSIPLAVTPNIKNPQNPWFYEHVGTMLYFTKNWGSWKHNHTLPIYIDNLDNLKPHNL